MKFVFAIILATGHETAQLYKVNYCIQNSRSSISGLVECLRLFHVNLKSVSNQLLMLDYFCCDAEQWLYMALKLSKAVFEWSLLVFIFVGRNIVVDTQTCYRLDGPGIEFHPDKPCTLQASYTKGIGSFSRVERHGRGVKHRTKSKAEIKEKAKPYHSYSSVPSWKTFLYIFNYWWPVRQQLCLLYYKQPKFNFTHRHKKTGIEYLFGSYWSEKGHKFVLYVLIINPTRCTNFSNLFLE